MDKVDGQTLLIEDTVEELRKSSDKSVSLIVTDPPYNHEDAIPAFLETVKGMYLNKMLETGQTAIFKEYGVRI